MVSCAEDAMAVEGMHAVRKGGATPRTSLFGEDLHLKIANLRSHIASLCSFAANNQTDWPRENERCQFGQRHLIARSPFSPPGCFPPTASWALGNMPQLTSIAVAEFRRLLM